MTYNVRLVSRRAERDLPKTEIAVAISHAELVSLLIKLCVGHFGEGARRSRSADGLLVVPFP